MGSEMTIVVGFSVISAILAYYAFELRDAEEDLTRKLSLFLFFLSILFLNLVMYSMVLIAQNTGLSYLLDSVVYTGLQIMTWVTLAIVIIYFIVLLLVGITSVIDFTKQQVAQRGRNRND